MHPVDQRYAWWATNAFYAVVVTVAGIGNVTATWLPWDWGYKAFAVAALEVGGVVLAINADTRRRLGESAWAWRVTSAAVAAIAAGINWFGHATHPILAVFFTAFSVVGYAVYLIRSGDGRRDQLRAEKKLPPTPPAYGPVQWLTHPVITHRARFLACKHTLGLYESLDAVTAEREAKAAAAAARARRDAAHAALREALADLLTHNVPEARRAAALATYDLDVMVEAARAEVDNAGVGRALAQSLTTDRIRRPAPTASDGDPDRPTPTRRRVVTTKPKPAAPRERVDPLVRHADRVSAVQSAIPDWKTRPGRITCNEVKEFAGVGGRDTQRAVRELIESLSDRGPVT
jgi:hypothetical protein